MSPHYTVVYDACVLYPAPLRSFLMYLAVTDLYRARWSNLIHEEWIGNLLEQRPDLTREQLLRVRDLMNQHVRGSLVESFEPLIHSVELPDQGDRHVVACAIHCGAEAIVTFNLKDFPVACLDRYGIRAVHPDDFLLDMLDLNASKVIEAARNHRASLKNPPFTQDEYFDCLQKQRLPQMVSQLRQYAAII